MQYHVVTIFPDIFPPYVETGMLRKATMNSTISVRCYNLRDFSAEKHRKIDDRPFGGGPGMVMTVQPVVSCVTHVVEGIKNDRPKAKIKIVFFSPSGEVFSNGYADSVLKKKYTDIIFICGRYEGVDSRVLKILKPESISIGPYVLTGGELPALVMIDAITRRIPGVLGDPLSLEEERNGAASSEMYTRPEVFEWKSKKYKVPKVLLNGNHSEIETWRKERNM